VRALAFSALGVFALLLARSPALAATVSATIDPPRFAVGESADLAIAVEGTQSAPTPQIASTGGLSISYVGPSTQMSFVNGRVSSSITHHFTVVGTKPGRYTIGPITVDADGKRYDAGTVTVELLGSGAAAGTDAGPGGDQLTLELSLPRTEVYVRERLPLGLKLLVGAVRVTDLQYPQIPGDGFALEKFPEPAQRREQTARGTMQVVDFTTTLTPLKPGTLTVGPATMSMSLVVQSRRNRGFFGGFFDESRPLQLQSQPITLTVLPLPSDGRPADFSGAVGRFTFETTATPTDVAAGDPVTVTMVVRGDGSLDGLASPSIPGGGDGLRVYPPQSSQGTPAPGERTFEQVVIPLREGTVTLPPVRLSFFDPAARVYRTLTPPPIALTVRASAQAHATPEIFGAQRVPAPATERPATLGRDIVFIKDAPGTLTPIGARPYHSAVWWLVQLLPVGLWAIAASYAKRHRRLTDDVRYARFTRAGRAARSALDDARAALGRGELAGGHDVVAGAIRDYLAAKLDLPPGTIAEAAPSRLRAAGVDGAVADRVVEFFAGCEALRFAPGGGSTDDLVRTIERADDIVRTLERARRIAPARAIAAVIALGLATQVLAAAGEGPSALFIRANGLYGNERYTEAAASYEQILAGGVESGAVQFNLGNAYLKAGDVGRAVLAYERARRLVPGDPDLAANLTFARDLAHDADEPSLLERIVFPLAGRVATGTLATAAAVAWWTVWLVLALGALVPAAAPIARGVAIAVGLGGAVAASSGAYRWWTLERPTIGVVIGRDVTVRAEPTPNATALFVAKPGTLLQVDRTREQAALVTSRDGRRGWVESAALTTL
jgi:tetratricopeptide (TPR) repeat protein